MPDFLNETRISFTKLARRENVHPSTIWRWTGRGVAGVKLEFFIVGGRRFTTLEAFARFVEATTAAANGAAPVTRTNRQRDAAISRAEAELAKAGV